jgi:hypothetical protein
MKKQSIISKGILFLTVTSLILWLGSYIIRNIVIYQLFEPINLDLRSIYNEQNLIAVFNIILPLITFNLVTYISFILFFIMFLLSTKIRLKNEGWLFISTIIILITMPFETYLSVYDYKIANMIVRHNAIVTDIVNLIRERITKLSSFSFIEFFSYLAIVFLTLFKPFRKVNEA